MYIQRQTKQETKERNQEHKINKCANLLDGDTKDYLSKVVLIFN